MNFIKALIYADELTNGIHIIDIDMYDENGERHNQPSKRFVNEMNAQFGLDKEKAKHLVSNKYHIPLESITFYED